MNSLYDAVQIPYEDTEFVGDVIVARKCLKCLQSLNGKLDFSVRTLYLVYGLEAILKKLFLKNCRLRASGHQRIVYC